MLFSRFHSASLRLFYIKSKFLCTHICPIVTFKVSNFHEQSLINPLIGALL
ncbi:unnamed protein product [Schistosoma curassoni]|uniref:Uncharacterized protein n=1 Tax=Schistosoma curassoni TaxID=6186 RepID=A0A183KRG2_9TREM|nr:unnamed protein product [Schistosoma curassoni]